MNTSSMTSTAGNARPFVSVVVPSYNARLTIEECLASLASQTYPEEYYEVLVADNGSTDGTQELVRTRFPWVKMVHATEKGSGYARNAGIDAARGEFVLSTDSDCVVAPDWMEILVDAMMASPAGVAAIGGQILPYSTRTPVEQHKPVWVSQPTEATREAGIQYAATPNAIFRVAAVRGVGGFNGKLGFDDTDLGLRLTKAGYRIEYTDRARVRHRNPSTLGELFGHRIKYGKHNFMLSLDHPHLLGDPMEKGKELTLFMQTLRRVVGDILVKQPLALVHVIPDRPRAWPSIDAVVAWGNWTGFRQAAVDQRKKMRADTGAH